MSGAEVLAVVGGIAAFSELLKNAKSIISWIRSGPSGDLLTTEISEVELRFELLAELERLDINSETDPSEALKRVTDTVSRQLNGLQKMMELEKYLKKATKRERARHALRQPARTKKLQDTLLNLDRSLRLVCDVLFTRCHSQNYPTRKASPSGELTLAEVGPNAPPHGKSAENGPCVRSSTPEEISRLQPVHRYFRPSNRSRCSRGTCACLCHRANRDIYHHRRAQGSPWNSLFIKCSCSTKSYSWTITAFQRQVSIILSQAHEQGFSLSSTLSICNTVPNTSPLFVVLYKCRNGYMKFEEAVSTIRSIESSGQGSRFDIDRDGESWVEKLVRCPWDTTVRQTQFALLDHFMSEEVLIKSERLLLYAIRWIGEGPHIPLLETILPRNGRPLVDPMEAHPSLFQQWPTAFDPNWISLYHTPDPFFVEALSLFVNQNPFSDFGDTGHLQYLIHSGGPKSIRDLLSQKDFKRFTEEKNFLQQSVLHISVTKPKVLELLLSRGFAEIVDVRDRYGATALMYAAAYGESTSAIELLRAGASPFLWSEKYGMYLDLALERGHFGLIEDIVNYYIAEGEPTGAQATLNAALHRYIWRGMRCIDPRLDGLRRLLELGARPRWVSEKGNTLFHAITSADVASLLLEFSSSPINSPNAVGYTPMMVLSCLLDVHLVRQLLSAAVLINERDRTGWTVLDHVFRASSSKHFSLWYASSCEEWIPTFEIMFELLQAGADFGSSDSCTCHCSSRGYTALQFLFPGLHSQERRNHNLQWIPCIVEMFLLLRGLHKRGLEMLIKALIRRQRFDEIGLTHTCFLASEDSLNSPYTSLYFSAREQEHSNDDLVLPISVNHKDFEELQGEQEELVQELEHFCGVFEKEKEHAPIDCESSLLNMLARRAVFIERGSTHSRSRLETKKYLQSPESYDLKCSDKVEIFGVR
ncbi:hypothetical protein BCR34DRAFT_258918 [Clohesyomyces aquaticus]|uniref:Uncharacterized protein n=1 Tax=Clohesyomyces aquaticus TaxID=1231657 RepID=A0A1Y2A8V6_9PLEO|nr:hypothetical protein BCR34DRAFT_258918 [Clohesyomyces aquaticus]